jgi:hypothetical protein
MRISNLIRVHAGALVRLPLLLGRKTICQRGADGGFLYFCGKIWEA